MLSKKNSPKSLYLSKVDISYSGYLSKVDISFSRYLSKVDISCLLYYDIYIIVKSTINIPDSLWGILSKSTLATAV